MAQEKRGMDPRLIGWLLQTGQLPQVPYDLQKVKSLTARDYKGPRVLPNQESWLEEAEGDWSLLGEMSRLHTLEFPELRLTDFTFLASCRALEKLDLHLTNFSDCAVLSGLTRLKLLSLPAKQKLTHMEALEGLGARISTDDQQFEALPEYYRPQPGKYYVQYICAFLEQGYRPSKTLRPFVGLHDLLELSGEQITPAVVDALVQTMRDEKIFNLYLTPFPPAAAPPHNDPPRHQLASQFVRYHYTHGRGAVIFNREKSIAFYRRLDQYTLDQPVRLRPGDEPPAHEPSIFDTPQKAGEGLRNLILTGCLEGGPARIPGPAAGQRRVDPGLLYWIGTSLGHIPQRPEELEQVRGLNGENYALNYPMFPDWLAPEPGNWSLVGLLPNLESLFMPQVRLEDYSFLLRCPGLKRLDLSKTNLFDGSVLENLPELTFLSLPASEFPDFSFLFKCPKLEILDVSQTNFRDCALLAQMPRLKLATLPARRQLIGPEILDTLYLQVKTDERRVLGEDVDPFELIRPRPAEEGWQDRKPPYKVLHIDSGDSTREGAEITAGYVSSLVKKLRRGDVDEVYLSLNPFGEEEFLAVTIARGWAALGFEDADEGAWYTIYNPECAGVEEEAPPLVGGQSPVPKMHTIQDLELAALCAEYFIKWGKLYPGAWWAKYYN